MLLSNCVFIACVLIFISRVQGELENLTRDQFNEKLVGFTKICMERTGADASVYKIFKLPITPEDDSQICFIDCLLKELNVFNEKSEVNLKELKALSELWYEKTENREKIGKFNELCKDVPSDDSKKCGRAYTLRKCFIDNIKKENVPVYEHFSSLFTEFLSALSSTATIKLPTNLLSNFL